MSLQSVYERMVEAAQNPPIPPEVALLEGAAKDTATSLEDSESSDYKVFAIFAAIVFACLIMVPTTIARGIRDNAEHSAVQREIVRE